MLGGGEELGGGCEGAGCGEGDDGGGEDEPGPLLGGGEEPGALEVGAPVDELPGVGVTVVDSLIAGSGSTGGDEDTPPACRSAGDIPASPVAPLAAEGGGGFSSGMIVVPEVAMTER